MRILYPIVYGLFYVVSRLPFRVLYFISDIFYVLVYRIAGYRKRVVRRNLETSFPEKDTKELRSIERGFYHFLCDYFLETIKMLTITPEEMRKRLEIRGLDAVEQCFDEGQDAAGILGHYCNWEYLSATGLRFERHSDAVIGLIYHPLRSAVIDRVFLKIREHLGGVCVPKRDILRHLITLRREGRKSLCGYISDQTPKWENIHLWLPFLNHETGVFTGGEKIMRKMNNAVFYLDMERPRRGYYVVTYRLITRHPAEMEPDGITRRFFEMLEQTIRRDPRFYLWSHNRWKRTREEFDRRFQVVNGKVLPKDNAS